MSSEEARLYEARLHAYLPHITHFLFKLPRDERYLRVRILEITFDLRRMMRDRNERTTRTQWFLARVAQLKFMLDLVAAHFGYQGFTESLEQRIVDSINNAECDASRP